MRTRLTSKLNTIWMLVFCLGFAHLSHGQTSNTKALVPEAGKIYSTYNLGQNLGILDLATGEFRDVGSYGIPESAGLSATAFSPGGALYGMLQGFFERGGMSQLVSINLKTGKATAIGVANPLNAVGFDIAPDGTAYAAGFTNPDVGMEGDTVLYRIDTATGQLMSWHAVQVENFSSLLCEVPTPKRIDTPWLRKALAQHCERIEGGLGRIDSRTRMGRPARSSESGCRKPIGTARLTVKPTLRTPDHHAASWLIN